MPKVAAIIVAGGSGTRYGGRENKIFARLEDQPLVLRAVQLFVNREDVVQTIVVISANDEQHLKTKFGANLGFLGVKVVLGGAQRCDSVANGLAAVGPDADHILVHDAVRPCVHEDWIDEVIAEAGKSGAAVPAVQITGTIKRVSEARIIEETIRRDALWQAQTPQVFRRDVIELAYARRKDFEGVPTDDAELVSASGYAVTVVDGDPRNLKITTKGDLKLAAAILKAMPPRRPKGDALGAFGEAQW